MFKTRSEGIIVPARSKDSIADIADSVRLSLNLMEEPFLPIVELYECLHLLVEDADFQVLESHEMGCDHGRTHPDSGIIYIREDVMEGAYDGRPRDRFTLSHEFGHLLLHKGIALSRINPQCPPKIYRNSEWQADVFASQLLMPRRLLSGYSDIFKAMEDFGVSFEAVMARQGEMKKQ